MKLQYRSLLLYSLAIAASLTSTNLGRVDIGISTIGIRILTILGTILVIVYFSFGILIQILNNKEAKIHAPLFSIICLVVIVGIFHTITAANTATAVSRFPRLLFGFGILYFIVNMSPDDNEIWISLSIFLIIFTLQVLNGNLDVLYTSGTQLNLFSQRRRTATAHLITVSFPFAVGLLLRTQEYYKRLLYGISALVLIVGVILTYQRGAWIATFGGTALFAIYQTKRRKIYLTCVKYGTLVGGFLILGAFLSSPSLQTRLLSIFTFDPSRSSNYSRFFLLVSGLELIYRYPILGIGYNFAIKFKTTSVYDKFYDGAEFVNSHNTIITSMNEYGLSGVILLILFSVVAIRGILACKPNQSSKVLSDTFLLFFLITGIYQAVTVIYYNPVYWFIISLGMAHFNNHMNVGTVVKIVR